MAFHGRMYRVCAICVLIVLGLLGANRVAANGAILSPALAPAVAPAPLSPQPDTPDPAARDLTRYRPTGAHLVAMRFDAPSVAAPARKGRDGAGGFIVGAAFGLSMTPNRAIKAAGLHQSAQFDLFLDDLDRLLFTPAVAALADGQSGPDHGDWRDRGQALAGDMARSLTQFGLMPIKTTRGHEIPLALSVGYGDDTAGLDGGLGSADQGAYIRLGAGLNPLVSASLSATPTQINIGLSRRSAGLFSGGVSVGLIDVTDKTDRRQISVSGSFSF